MSEFHKRDFKGVWIPKEVWLHKDLSLLERALWAEIHSLDTKDGCTASNEYFATFFGVSIPSITRGISKLKKLKFIKQESFNGRYRVLRSNLKLIREPNQNDEADSSKRLDSQVKMTSLPSQNDEYINIDINTDINMFPFPLPLSQKKGQRRDNQRSLKGNIDKELFEKLRSGIYREDLFSIYDNLKDVKTIKELVADATYTAIKSTLRNNDAFLREQFDVRYNRFPLEKTVAAVEKKFPYDKFPNGSDPDARRNFFIVSISNTVAETLAEVLELNREKGVRLGI